jgi:hypothetical protein
MKKGKSLFFLIFFYYILIGYGQGFKHLTIENGLPSNRIYKVVQDKQGFIWVGTDKGLSKYDGDKFINFTTEDGLPSNDIWEIYPDNKGRVWFFTRANSIGFIKNNKVYNFYAKDKNTVFYPVTINRTKDSIIFNSFGKFFHLKDSLWTPLLVNKKMGVKIIHPQIDVINFIRKDSIYMYDKQGNLVKSIPYNKSEIKKKEQVNDSLFVILTVDDMYFLNLNRKKLLKIPKLDIVNYNKFIRFYADSSSIQISGYNFWAELSKDYQLTHIKKNTIPNISNIFKDFKNNYWLNSYNKGIYFSSNNSLDTKYFFTNKKIQFLKKSLSNKLVVGVIDEGIYEYIIKDSVFKLIYPTKKYFYNVHYIDKNNFVLFGKNFALIKKDGKEKQYLKSGKKAIFFKNHYYTTNIEGLKKFNKNLDYISTIPLNDPISFIEFKKHLIIGGLDGLYTLTDDEKDFSKIEFTDISINVPILSLALYNDKLLIGTDGKGLFLWNGDKKLIQVKNTAQLIIKDILVKGDKVWIATQKGVLVYKENNKQLEFFQTLRKNDGLVSDQVEDIEFVGNKLMAASINGISIIDTNQSPNRPLQNIYFKSIKYGNRNLKDSKNKVFFNERHNLVVKFGAIDFSGQEHNHFYYRLLPNQKNWVITQSKVIEFSNLKPDEYQLEIKGINPYGQSIKKSFSFEIEPLWWQTKWAKIGFLFSLLIFFMFISFILRKKELAKQRKKLIEQKEKVEFELYALRSQMNPHFVFNSLNAIQYYINDENYDKSESYLVKFSKLIRMIFEFSRFKSVKLKDEIKLLESYLEIEKMRFGEDFNFCIKIDPQLNLDQIEIPTMLLQPIVENAVNHGIFHKQGKGTICLEFKKLEENSFQITISDDGIGIKKSKEINKKSLKKHTSRSTEILMKRIKLLNLSGKWKIDYNLADHSDNNEKYNTIVTLKITKL